MKITLYKYTGEPNRLNKTLDETTAYTINNSAFNTEFRTIQPEIRISSKEDLTVFNYAYMDGKYYFVTNVIKYRTNFFNIALELDTLMTYKDEILKLVGTVTQSQSALYLDGVNIPVSGHTKVKKYDFPNDVFNTDGCYVLIGLGYVAES